MTETPVNEDATRLTNVARRQDHANSRPRDAATLVLIDARGSETRVLMGRRHDGHVFMPGKYVFPGGRVEAADHRIPVRAGLCADAERKLLVDMKGGANPGKARALALAAIRETFEETGLLVGRRGRDLPATRSPAWRAFLDHGVVPDLSGLSFVCRAITPPRRPRRFDTRFFCASAASIVNETAPPDGELADLQWLRFSEARALDLPTITQIVLEALSERLKTDSGLSADTPVPYFYMRNGVFHRELIA